MRPSFLLFLILTVTIIAGCKKRETVPPAPGAVDRANASFPERQGPATGEAKRSVRIRPESLAYIKVQETHPEAYNSTISAPARVDFRAKAISTAGTVVAGRVSKIHVQIGDRVKAGDPLATLASAEALRIRSDFSRAKAELIRTEDRYRRQEQMQRTGVGLEMERQEAEADLREARAEYEHSLNDLRLIGDGMAEEVVVRAPMASSVLHSHASVGAMLERGSPLFDLGEPSALWIVADVFEKDLILVEKGAKATIEIPSLMHRISGHVVAESASIQADLRRASVFIEPEDSKISLRPGMYARVFIEAAGPSDIVLPTTAILIRDGKQTLVYVEVGEGLYEPRNVVVGQSREGMTPILQGLSGGERVVVSGALLLDSEAAMLL